MSLFGKSAYGAFVFWFPLLCGLAYGAFVFLVSFWCLVVQPVGLLLFVSTHCLVNHQVTSVTFFLEPALGPKRGRA